MSDTNANRLRDPQLDADLTHVADDDKADPTPARLGSAPAADAADDPDLAADDAGRQSMTGEGARRSSVEGVDEAAATREAIDDTTR